MITFIESLHTTVVPCSSIDELVMINASTDAPIVTYTVLVLLYMSGLCKHVITLSKKTFALLKFVVHPGLEGRSNGYSSYVLELISCSTTMAYSHYLDTDS